MDFSTSADAVSVLYVGGMGRSGSTLLERLLGQLPGACNLGEVIWIWDRGIRRNERCGCGQDFWQCPFWTEIGSLAFGGWDNVDVERVESLARAVDDVKYVPRMLLPLPGTRFAERRDTYTQYFKRIYSAAAELTGATTIIDSSKQTSLAYALSHDAAIDLKVLHLLRDPRGVAHSWTKIVRRPEVTDEAAFMPRYNTAYMAALWSGHNALLSALRTRHVPTKQVTYEDFVTHPAAVLTSISAFLGRPVSPSDLRFVDTTSATLLPAHSVAGNPMRFQTGRVEIHRDERWRQDMPDGQRRIVSTISAPAALAFGYRPWARAAGSSLKPFHSRLREEDTEAVETWPSVTAIIPSHGRPEMLRTAVTSIVEQKYPGQLDVIVVHDKEPVDESLSEQFPGRAVAIENRRTPGLCGARNTGIMAAEGELVAFCDDDDVWLSGKLVRQVARLAASPGAVMASTAMTVNFMGVESDRLAAKHEVTYDDLLVSRMSMLHSSSFVLFRDWMLHGELLNEDIPGSVGEDWDLLLRAARVHPIAHLDEPLVKVLWGSTSFFSRDWRTKLIANAWFLDQYPDIRRHRSGTARLTGQNAFFAAASGDRASALRWIGRSLRVRPLEPRAWLAVPVVVAPRLGDLFMAALHRHGRGI